MARPTSIQRKINRCYYWTPLTWEECIDRHMPLDRDMNSGPQPLRLTSFSSQEEDKPAAKYGLLAIVLVLLFIMYKFI